ncbi:MAG: 30S ribosomal protein S9 [Candidatus Pacebacteria bacterium]|nr:30S ribosomal protein S9 [Candidatus Paceibacterota bacterium]
MPTTTKEKTNKKADKYYQGVGRRKTSSCTVRIYEKKNGGVVVNDKKMEDYFPTPELQKTVKEALTHLDLVDNFYISVKVFGGGVKSQAEAVRHGISRALVVFNEEFRKKLKSTGYLTRDPRMRERKKPGLTRARRAPQWRKR